MKVILILLIGHTGTMYELPDNRVISSLSEKERSQCIIDSGISISADQEKHFVAGPAYKFRGSILRVMDALWCRKHLLSYLLPKVKNTGDSDLFNGISTLKGFKEACENHEKRLRFMITVDKVQPMSKRIQKYFPKARKLSRE